MRLRFAILILLVPITARAQTPALRPHHITFTVGIGANGGYDIGSAKAELRGNGAGATPPSFTLLTAESRLARATAAEFRVGIALTRRLAIEFGGMQSNPRVAVKIAADAEAPAQDLFGEELQQYFFEGGVTWQLPFASRKMAPFLALGGGYLRQLHEERTLGEDGRVVYAGGGARYWLRGKDGASKALGLRGDVRIKIGYGGIDFADAMRVYPAFSLAVFVGL